MEARRTRGPAGLIALGVVVVTLSACASLGTTPEPAALTTRNLTGDFILEGRLSATDGERAASGRLEWAHSTSGDRWMLFSPTGQMIAELVSAADGATLRTADGRIHGAQSAEQMLPALLGIPAPLDGLIHWVQAVPRAGAQVLTTDDMGRPLRLGDAGWIIDYREYRSDAPAALPRRIDASWGDARIRLVIDHWTTSP